MGSRTYHSDLDAVILGMHARADNPELLRAQELKLAIYSFPEYIYEESRNKTRVAIGGSHGKTTITSMVMHVLRQCRLQFDYLVGARLEGFAQSVNITNAPSSYAKQTNTRPPLSRKGPNSISSTPDRCPERHRLGPYQRIPYVRQLPGTIRHLYPDHGARRQADL